jgi:Holliday junction resolvase-like predicted endonuclease
MRNVSALIAVRVRSRRPGLAESGDNPVVSDKLEALRRAAKSK